MSFAFFVMLGLFAVNVMTPGASFVLTVTNAMTHGRRSGLFIALGLSSADTVFAAMAAAGLAALVAQNILVVKAISLLGGMWFVYGGVRLMLKQKATQLPQEALETAGDLSVSLAYRLGLTAGMSNPQSVVFFSTAFLAALSAHPSTREAIALVIGVAGVSAITRCSIVAVFTTKVVMHLYTAQRRKVETVSGGMLALFGVKLAAPAAVVISHVMLN